MDKYDIIELTRAFVGTILLVALLSKGYLL